MLFDGDGTHCFERKTGHDCKKEKPSPFLKKFRHQSQSRIPESEPKKNKNNSIYGIIVSTPHWSIQLTKYCFPSSFQTLSIYSYATWFFQSPTTVLRLWVVSPLWTRFNYSDCKISRPRNDNKFPTKASGSMELVVVSTTRLFDQPSSERSSYPQPARNDGDSGWSTFKYGRTRHRHLRVSSVWSGRCWVLLGNWSAGCRRCL